MAKRAAKKRASTKRVSVKARGGARAETASVVQIELVIEMEAERGRVWRSLVNDIGAWWPGEFLCTPRSGGIRIEARPGGRVYEENAEGGGMVWYTVVSIDPGTSMYWMGVIAPPWGGPCSTVVWLRLEDSPRGTRLTILDSLIGRVGPGQVKAMKDGWTQIFGGGLKAFVERGAG